MHDTTLEELKELLGPDAPLARVEWDGAGDLVLQFPDTPEVQAFRERGRAPHLMRL